MGKVMKKIGNVIGKVTQIVSPILSIAKMIPGVGQIAGVIDAGLKIASNIGNIMKKGLPRGLLDAASLALKGFLPGPLGNIASFVTDKVNNLKSLIPAGVQRFLPQVNLPVVRDIANVL